MKRLVLILLCHLSVYLAYAVCDWGNPIADTFDLRRHIGYYLSMGLLCQLALTKPDKYEDWVIFLTVVFIEGVLVNCIIFTWAGDREFHWYSVAIIILSFGRGVRKGWPHRYEACKEFLIDVTIVPIINRIKNLWQTQFSKKK